jgi:hypothetical protein
VPSRRRQGSPRILPRDRLLAPSPSRCARHAMVCSESASTAAASRSASSGVTPPGPAFGSGVRTVATLWRAGASG